MEPSIGTLFNGRYLLEAELGRGGMGVVYRAHDNLLERKVAVKLLSSKQIGTEGRARLLREAQAAARLNHPNIVSIFDAGETEGISFIIMELLEGEALYDLKPLPLEKSLDIIRQVCKALEHAHAHGIVHRDLKPENVIISPTGVAKLTDFGLARSAASRLTAEGAFIGTIHYMSPEQALGEDVDGRTDLYALGAMLYEMAAGRLPFTGDDPLAIISQHLHAPVIPPRNYNLEIPPALDRLIVRLLSKQRDDRPASAALVRQALEPEALQASSPQPAEPLSSLDILVRGRLVGREQELAEAKSLWRQAMAGASPQPILLISGEPGIGKTPLVREIKALAEVSGGTILLDECYAEGSAPFAPLSQVIQQALQKGALNLPDVILADLVELSPSLRARYTQLAPNQPLDSTSGQHRLFESVVALFSSLAERAPVLLVLEDVHWADASTLSLLRHLARRARSAQMRLLIVLTYRESELENAHCLREALPEFNRERLAARIKLGRYDRQQTRRLLTIMFQEEIDPAFAEAIFKETDGNLFFIEEICRALIEQGKLTHQHGRWQWSDLKDLELPQSVRLATQSRLNSLPANTQDVLRLAAIIGREFSFDILHAACELEEDLLVEALETAEHAQLITESRAEQTNGSSKEHFAFVHGLIVTTLRGSVSGLRRHRLHRRVAAAISSANPEDYPALAYHYQQAQDLPAARGYYIKAGERALSIFANQEAGQYFRSALDLTEDEAERTPLLTSLGEALFRQSLYDDANQAWLEAIELHSHHAEYDAMARLYSRAARSAWYGGEARRGLELCLQGMHETASAPESPGKAALMHETARAYFFNGQREETGPLCEQALEMAERLGLVEVQADTLATFGLLPDLPHDTRRQRLKRAVELAESAGLLAIAARAHLNLGGRLQEDGEHAPARAHFLRAYELAQKMGMDTWAYDFLSSAAYVSLDMGDFPAVEAALAELKGISTNHLTASQVGALATILEVRLLAYQGHWEQAEQMLHVIEDNIRALNDITSLVGVLSIHGWILLEQDRLTEARPYLDEAVKLSWEDGNISTFEPFFFSFMLAVQERRVETARAFHADMRKFLQVAPQDPRGIETLQWTSALLATLEGRWEEAFNVFETLTAASSHSKQRWSHARTLLNWGEIYAGRDFPGDRPLAREKFLAAQELFIGLKADGYLEKIQKLLAGLESPQPTAAKAQRAP